MSDSDGGSLTRREFDAVIRRASELASSDPDAEEGTLTEGELFRIAGEVGLSDEHVRTALADVRSSGEGGGLLDRMFGPSSIRVARVVGGAARAVDQRDRRLSRGVTDSPTCQEERRPPAVSARGGLGLDVGTSRELRISSVLYLVGEVRGGSGRTGGREPYIGRVSCRARYPK